MVEWNLNTEGYDPNWRKIPEGEYVAIIVGDEIKHNQAGTWEGLKIKWQICDEKCNGKTVVQSITKRCETSATAEQIGVQQMYEVIHACGRENIMDVLELYDTPCKIHVKHRGEYVDVDWVRPLCEQPKPGPGAPGDTPFE